MPEPKGIGIRHEQVAWVDHGEGAKDNAQAIVALHNAAPALLDDLDAAQARIAALESENAELRAHDIEANDACVRMEKRITELSAKCDAAMGALDEMCDALGIPTDGRADGPSANAALAQARAEGYREGVEAVAARLRARATSEAITAERHTGEDAVRGHPGYYAADVLCDEADRALLPDCADVSVPPKGGES